MATYKGPDGRLYRVSEAPGIRGTYRIEYLDPACSVVYKQLPGYNDNANREEVVALLGKLAKDRGLEAAVEDSSAAEPLQAPALKGSGVWLYGDHRVMRVGIGSDTERSDARYYHVLVLNLLANQTCWRKRSGSGNYDYKHIPDADEELHEVLPEDAHELTSAEVDRMFMDGLYTPYPQAAKVWDEIMASAASKDSADPCATCLCNTCADEYCNAPGCYKDKDACVHTHNTAKCDAYRPKSSPEPATAEPQEIADESSDRDTPAATLSAAPATEIAAPAFDFGADEPTNAILLQCAQTFVAGRLAQVMAAKRAHDLTANNKNGAFGKWCEAVGISRDTGNNLVNIADNFGNIELNGKPLVELTPISLLSMASKPSAHPELKQGVGDGSITNLKEYKELEAKLKAAEAAREAAEKKAQGLKASYNTAHANEQYNIDLRKKAQEAVEDLKQKLYRRNDELAKKEQALNVTMDQQGVYIAKMQEQEDMLADLQDRLDDTTAQLRSRPVPAEVVDQDEIERRAAELAAQKIAEAEARARAETTGKAPTIEGITDLANGYAAQIDGMRTVLAQLTQGLERQAITHAADKLCLAADRLHDLIMYGPEAYSHG